MSEILNSVVASLKSSGLNVPPQCDEATAIRLVTEALAATSASGRDLRLIEQRAGRLRELLELDAPARQVAPGSSAWRAQRRRENIRSDITAAEDALVEALRDAYAGYVIFSGHRGARPRREALLEVARELRIRDARGELPLPSVGGTR